MEIIKLFFSGTREEKDAKRGGEQMFESNSSLHKNRGGERGQKKRLRGDWVVFKGTRLLTSSFNLSSCRFSIRGRASPLNNESLSKIQTISKRSSEEEGEGKFTFHNIKIVSQTYERSTWVHRNIDVQGMGQQSREGPFILHLLHFRDQITLSCPWNRIKISHFCSIRIRLVFLRLWSILVSSCCHNTSNLLASTHPLSQINISTPPARPFSVSNDLRLSSRRILHRIRGIESVSVVVEWIGDKLIGSKVSWNKVLLCWHYSDLFCPSTRCGMFAMSTCNDISIKIILFQPFPNANE